MAPGPAAGQNYNGHRRFREKYPNLKKPESPDVRFKARHCRPVGRGVTRASNDSGELRQFFICSGTGLFLTDHLDIGESGCRGMAGGFGQAQAAANRFDPDPDGPRCRSIRHQGTIDWVAAFRKSLIFGSQGIRWAVLAVRGPGRNPAGRFDPPQGRPSPGSGTWDGKPPPQIASSPPAVRNHRESWTFSGGREASSGTRKLLIIGNCVPIHARLLYRIAVHWKPLANACTAEPFTGKVLAGPLPAGPSPSGFKFGRPPPKPHSESEHGWKRTNHCDPRKHQGPVTHRDGPILPWGHVRGSRNW